MLNQTAGQSLLRQFTLMLIIGSAQWCTATGISASEHPLPDYIPDQTVSGVIRNYGNAYGGLLKKWEDGFRDFHPGIQFDDTLPTSDAAFPALITGVTDLAPNGSEASLTETLGFFEVHGHHPTAITVASGSFDTEGRSPGIVVFVHKDNPITQLSLAQLDGIFGAQRNGGLRGFQWTLEDARGPEKDIRSWGQLGLEGQWQDQLINTYGHAPSGAARFFQHRILKNSNKWNPNFQGYVETGSKMIGETDRQTQYGGIQYMLTNKLANDRFGIAWTIMPQAQGIEGIKALALGRSEDGPFVYPDVESFQSRTYPLVRNIYIYLNRAPGEAVADRFREFLRYILSAQGQALVADGSGFLPLPAAEVNAQRAKLD
ncbi:MAG: phosphate transport system substrate-binding protein [Lysobacterales bacterium]|jgi:phosphate transport system substrate-binding protein